MQQENQQPQQNVYPYPPQQQQYAQPYPDQQMPYYQPGGAQIIMQQPQMHTEADHIDTQLIDENRILRSSEMDWQPHPQQCICKNCNREITTVITAETTLNNELKVLYLCLLCCIAGLLGLCVGVILLYCMDYVDPVVHHCPECNTRLCKFEP